MITCVRISVVCRDRRGVSVPLQSLVKRTRPPHTAEIVAASYAQHGIVPKRGLHAIEIHIPSTEPTILYCDSQSAVFVAEENGRVRRSAWVLLYGGHQFYV